ncbi:pilus assembly protein TadG-related protein [Nocardiopsis quinghaiensis]|uniref:pilus assembly protein TadG-related protein n=1 Tax=Nocardiopsis quinghaiensis TaxID=464995 RepID=UPI00123BE0DE|nr:pilus assembly protein TadG-related protein [Nocardiopsis quinghaiensis]
MRYPDSHDDRGQATAFLIVMAAALLLLVAFVFDVGGALSERNRTLQLAQEAARAGAQQIDLAAYRADGTVALDPAAAVSAANDFLAEAGIHGTATVDGDVITVTAQSVYTFRLLPLGPRTASGTASATPVTEPTTP